MIDGHRRSARFHGGKGHLLELTRSREGARLRVAGEIDLVAAADLTRLLVSLDRLNVPINVDLGAVSFLDSNGVEPLVEASRRRNIQRLPPLLIGRCSRRARRLLDVAGIDGCPYLDIDAWDRLGQTATNQPRRQRRQTPAQDPAAAAAVAEPDAGAGTAPSSPYRRASAREDGHPDCGRAGERPRPDIGRLS